MPTGTRITKGTVDRIVADGRDRIYWDGDLEGFGLRVRPSGHKAYVVRFRAGGRTHRVTLGPHGVLTPEAARRRALAVLAEVWNGGDPVAARDADRAAGSVADLCERFLEEYVEIHCKPGTVREYTRLLRKIVVPAIGRRKAADIRRRDVAALHFNLRDTRYQANRTLALLSKMFNMAEIWELRPDGSNPCRHIRRYREESRERFLSVEEFRRLGKVLDDVLVDGSESHSAVTAIRLLMLTGCRLSEILTLRWAHVDLAAGELNLLDTKTGGRAVPLAPAAVRLLADLPRKRGNPWVIPGRKRGAHLVDLQPPWQRIRARAGLPGVRIHGLRHSFASRALALGESLPMIGKILGHTQIQTTARYAHLARDMVVTSVSRIGDSIEQDLGLGG